MAASETEERRGRVGGHVHDTILAAAADLICERRVVPTMAEIAQEAGVGRATVYRYFPSRERLLQGLLEAAEKDAVQRLREAHLASVPFPEALARATRALVAVGSRILVVMREGGVPHHPKERDELKSVIRRLLARGRREGYLRADVPQRWTEAIYGRTLLAGLEHVHDTGAGVEDASALIVEQFLHGSRLPPPAG